MTTLFQRTSNDWRDIGGLDTAEEIAHQPALWRTLAGQLSAGRSELAAFLGDSLRDPQARVILTGAGSSAYVGEIIADDINAAWPCQVRAIATTSLLTHPALYLESGAPTLLVSFARSGNSPESSAAVQLVRDLVPGARFLNITCNADGDLARQGAQDANTFNLLMPAASCDRGFAMTSSFTCMLLAALCALDPDFQPQHLNTLADLGEQAAVRWAPDVAQLAKQRVSRVIYLGSGPLEALAKEAALKIMELTAGSVMTMANSALGFRHGPKAAVTPETLVLLFRSADPLSRRYEQDLLQELRRDQVASAVLTIGAGGDFAIDTPAWPDAWLAPLWLLMAQQYALHQSALLQLRPDNPFTGGIVNRVVQGVTIYRHDDL
ncbi:tagatose-6-phosphate ketose/aldose isomerase [Duganella sp. 1224]|uniref:SIS domain-containing protein n=1 Tax=Duganella sp. 1224 TaxID=2587052 RepID=UPI0015CC7326|nr:SIS domain-containing protein [Duganella sp. 1224]NYE60817.1 tagatose-6-phosphate ketose/aldose isomerase [Duganella sp. 1224]